MCSELTQTRPHWNIPKFRQIWLFDNVSKSNNWKFDGNSNYNMDDIIILIGIEIVVMWKDDLNEVNWEEIEDKL